MSGRENAKWFEEGIAFECQRCGKCCVTHGGYAYVYLSSADIRAMASHLGLSESAFLEGYCARLAGQIVLRFDSPDCPMLEDGRCIVYSVRPVQCRTWPFWPENLSRDAWERKIVPFCGGVGKGKRIAKGTIERMAEEMERA